ncbi:TIP60 [Enterospora canceri]|uniref:histone acetyltransferase n=1 Tax=Enterospora canceri TaxID=1081671 RepID=A0A1Y1S5N7_9MICR|nr:TIP60 [Enterospora canceri]
MSKAIRRITGNTTDINYGTHTFSAPNTLCRRVYDGFNICSKCLWTFVTEKSLKIHNGCCKGGNLKIFYECEFKEGKHGKIGFTRINRLSNKQTLAALGDAFIRQKTVYCELNLYEFYAAVDLESHEIMGYFSRHSQLENSLSCLVVFPPYQGCGIGTLLIDLSQQKAITRSNGIEYSDPNKIYVPLGPERPLSDTAYLCYKNYWAVKTAGARTVQEVAEKENIGLEDAVVGLEANGFDFNEWRIKKKMPRRKLKRELPDKLVR